LEDRHQYGSEERLNVKVAGSPQNLRRLRRRWRCDLDEMTRCAIDPNRWQFAKMFHVASAKSDRPPEVGISDQSQMAEVIGRKQIGIRFDKCAQHRLRNDLRSHRTVEKEI